MRFRLPASLRMAWDIIRAWTPTVWSPIWPSSSARGVSAATESIATRSTAPGADEHVGDLERLLAVVGLRDEQLVDVHAEVLGVQGVHGVLRVYERAHAAELLGLGDDVVDQRRLARGLRAEDLDDAAARHAADAEREVERQRAGGDRIDLHLGALVAHAHDGALAELALDLRERALQRGVARLDFLGVLGCAHLVSCDLIT